MKHPHTRLVSPFLIGALLTAGLSSASAQTSSKPIVITPPAVNDGSNASRAPYVAARQFDDVNPPNAEPIDLSSPPNTVASNIEPAIPAARVAVMQPATPATTTYATVSTEPVLTPTGRDTVTVATTPATTTYVYPAATTQTQTQTYTYPTRAKPLVITPPAVNDGSNFSRAPFVAARQFDDVNAPNAEPIDLNSPPNTVASNIEPALPAARVAVMQTTTTTPAAYAVVTTEPALTPTGRSLVAVSTSLDAATLAPRIRTSPFGDHQVVVDVETRMQNSDSALAAFRSTTKDMSAEGRKAFNAAADEVKEKAKALKKSIKNAHSAKDSEWENARTQLAADYEAYAAAVARVDAAAGIAPASR